VTPAQVAAHQRAIRVRDLLWQATLRLSDRRISHALGLAGEALEVFPTKSALYTCEAQSLDSLIAVLACCVEETREPKFHALGEPAAALLRRAVRLRLFATTGRAA